MNIGKYLTKKIGKNVVVLNDVDAGTYGEYHLGAAKELIQFLEFSRNLSRRWFCL